jgi:hypothetical protein
MQLDYSSYLKRRIVCPRHLLSCKSLRLLRLDWFGKIDLEPLKKKGFRVSIYY